MHAVNVWTLRSGKDFFLVSSLGRESVMSFTSGTLYKDEHVLHISTTESISTVKGLGRAVLVRALSSLVHAMGRPCIYFYCRPRKSFYLSSGVPGLGLKKLSVYWESVLADIGYEMNAIGRQSVMTGEFTNILAKHPQIVQCLNSLEDDPVSRVWKSAPGLSLEQVFAVLANSKDLTEGMLVFSKGPLDGCRHAKEAENTSNAPSCLVDVPLEEVHNLIETGSVAGLLKYPSIEYVIEKSALEKKEKKEEVKVIRLKRNK
ncbi:hypothetical protein NECID01_0858 [Nematocida sp. AWRm77]|nr:hypothetical protein NECID01_0858 [Nematocida sp. AWRm77]